MKKTKRIIELILGNVGNRRQVIYDEEQSQHLLATLLNREVKFEGKKNVVEELLFGYGHTMNAEQVAQVSEALFLCLEKGCIEDEVFPHYCDLVRGCLKQGVELRHGTLIGSMQAVAWLYENDLWDELDLHVAYLGFLDNGYMSYSDEPQPRFDKKFSGMFSNISTSLVAACQKGLPEYLHAVTRYPIVWDPVPPQKHRVGESPLFRQIIDEISYRAFLLRATNERLVALDAIYNPQPAVTN